MSWKWCLSREEQRLWFKRGQKKKKNETNERIGYVFEEHRKLETIAGVLDDDDDDLYNYVFVILRKLQNDCFSLHLIVQFVGKWFYGFVQKLGTIALEE